jgi:hypothetical protein
MAARLLGHPGVDLAELGHRAVDEALDRPDGAVEEVGDLTVFQVLEAAEDEDLLLMG